MNDATGLSSAGSLKRSLEAVQHGSAGLNARRQSLLDRVPNSNDWAPFEVGSVEVKDIAYLAASTHHEFAILRGKTRDILFHGTERHCNFSEELLDLLKTKKLRLVAHTHPDRDRIVPSLDDRRFLTAIDQKDSIIISSVTGVERVFNANIFDDLGGEDI